MVVLNGTAPSARMFRRVQEAGETGMVGRLLMG